MAILRNSLCIALAVVFFASGALAKEGLRLYEQEIKAGLLYNFLKYTNWPESAGGNDKSKMMLCIFGKDPFGGYLDPMDGRSVNQRIITIQNINLPAEAAGCHMVFISSGSAKRWPDMHKFLRDEAILTVSDFDGFAQSGGMIEFTKKDNRINVELNIDAVKAANLSVHNRLLKLVTIVYGGR